MTERTPTQEKYSEASTRKGIN